MTNRKPSNVSWTPAPRSVWLMSMQEPAPLASDYMDRQAKRQYLGRTGAGRYGLALIEVEEPIARSETRPKVDHTRRLHGWLGIRHVGG